MSISSISSNSQPTSPSSPKEKVFDSLHLFGKIVQSHMPNLHSLASVSRRTYCYSENLRKKILSEITNEETGNPCLRKIRSIAKNAPYKQTMNFLWGSMQRIMRKEDAKWSSPDDANRFKEEAGPLGWDAFFAIAASHKKLDLFKGRRYEQIAYHKEQITDILYTLSRLDPEQSFKEFCKTLELQSYKLPEEHMSRLLRAVIISERHSCEALKDLVNLNFPFQKEVIFLEAAKYRPEFFDFLLEREEGVDTEELLDSLVKLPQTLNSTLSLRHLLQSKHPIDITCYQELLVNIEQQEYFGLQKALMDVIHENKMDYFNTLLELQPNINLEMLRLLRHFFTFENLGPGNPNREFLVNQAYHMEEDSPHLAEVQRILTNKIKIQEKELSEKSSSS